MLNKIKNQITNLRPLYVVAIFSFIASIFLILYPLPNQLHFSYDQARDAYEAYSIWHDHDLKILGPSTDIPGVFHGVLWFYVLSLFYNLSGNEPFVVAFFFFPFFLLSILIIYLASYRITRDKNVALIGSAIYSLFPLFNFSTRWLSNPILSIIIAPLLLLTIWEYINSQSKIKSLIVGLLFGLLIQSNISYGIFLFTIPLYFYFFKLKIRISEILLFLFGICVTTASFFLADIKFKGQTLFAFYDFFGKHGDFSITQFSAQVFEKSINLLRTTTLPFQNEIIIIILFLVFFRIGKLGIGKGKREIVFSLIWLSNILIYHLFSSGVINTFFIFFPSLLAIALISSLLLSHLTPQKFLVPAFGLIVISQIYAISNFIKHDFTILGVQQGANLSKVRQVVDWTYKEANGKPFTINTVTNPLYINTSWAYAYEFYGLKKYGYLPFWGGRDQAGYLGNLPTTLEPTMSLFLIVEPKTGIDDFYINSAGSEADKISNFEKYEYFGNYYIEKRITKEEKSQ